MPIGGEFYYDPSWQVTTPLVETGQMTFLNGGKACLIVISEFLREQGIRRVLLPAYLCPTIVNTLERSGLTCGYYHVTPQLTIDLDDLARQAREYRAVYFINYFGFPRSSEELALLRELQKNGALLVEDNAQAGFCETFCGDFVFNSMRKLCAYDGGYLETSFDVQPQLNRWGGQVNRRLPLIREYRSRLAAYLFRADGRQEELQDLYKRAEQYYDEDWVVEGDGDERRGIEHLDWPAIVQKRRKNYRYLLDLLITLPELTPLYPGLPEGAMPYGMPVTVPGAARDWLFEELGRSGIGLTIHWEAICRDPRLNRDTTAVRLASEMLTLVIDQRVTHKQLDYLALTLRRLIKATPR